MVLRPVFDSSAQPPHAETVSAWKAVEEMQHANASEYWLVPQPAHAALSGDIAAKLRPEIFGPIDATVARCIALHDAGWSAGDAAAIQELRASASSLKNCPPSFVDASPDEATSAWTASIETAEKFAPIGGYLGSSHFVRLAGRMRQSAFERFVAREKGRQERLLKLAARPQEQLEKLVDALQFCDLLSLYLCCGARQRAWLQCGPAEIQIRLAEGEYRLSPSPFAGPQQFNFPALHCSIASKPAKARAATTGAAARKNENAIFYINL